VSTIDYNGAADAALLGAGAEPRDFLALLKPRVMSLVVFTAFTGLVLAPGDVHPVLAAIALLAIAAGAGASGALNHWYDADIDARMRRTAGRPVPSGRVAPAEALAFGLVLACLSGLVLGLAANWLAAGLLAFTILFYVVVYTMWLKRRTPQNIVIGGAAGALPPIVGWAAMAGEVSLLPLLLFAIIFLWTPPHFWALALFRAEDYARAGVPMLPNVAGPPSTRRQILVYAALTAVAGVAPFALGLAGPLLGVPAILLGALFVARAWQLLRHGDADKERAAKRLFGFSILYLFAVFAAALLDRAAGALLA